MNLWQSVLALGALCILSAITISTNNAILSHTDNVNGNVSRVTALALAQSLAEEAMSKYFDADPEDETPGTLDKLNDLTDPRDLGHGFTERYRNGTHDFNDFDDYNNLFIVYKSSNPADTASTPGSDYEQIVPGLTAKYYVKARVNYVNVTASNIPLADQISTNKTWHKKITVTVINTATMDSVVYPAIMSYWN